MPTNRPEPSVAGRRLRRLAAAGLSAALLLTGAVACSLDVPFVGATEPSPEVADGPAPALAPALQRLLGDRAAALRRGDQRAFERTLAGGDRGALVVEERIFHNFSSLPLATFGYQLEPDTVRRDGDDVVAQVLRAVQLGGFDDVPVRTEDRMRFTRAPGSRRGWLVSSGTDEAWREAEGVPLQPWDLERVEVRRSDRVLLVTDAASAADAEGLLPAIESGVADVGARVPYEWDRTVVVYALSDPRFLDRLGDVPGGDPERLDGVTFPVRARGRAGGLASTRFVLHPRMLAGERRDRDRDRLVRHELVHVALGLRDDLVPTWLAEGIAEWVSAAGLPEQDRSIASDAVELASAGPETMPSDETFNDADAGAHYGLAWFACVHIADTYGDTALWDTFDAMRAAGAAAADRAAEGSAEGSDTAAERQSDDVRGPRIPAADAEAVLQERLGVGSSELAEASARRILTTFG